MSELGDKMRAAIERHQEEACKRRQQPQPTFEEWLRTSEYANTPRARKLLKQIEAQPKPKHYKLAY